jgi:hypothetical protein
MIQTALLGTQPIVTSRFILIGMPGGFLYVYWKKNIIVGFDSVMVIKGANSVMVTGPPSVRIPSL